MKGKSLDLHCRQIPLGDKTTSRLGEGQDGEQQPEAVRPNAPRATAHADLWWGVGGPHLQMALGRRLASLMASPELGPEIAYSTGLQTLLGLRPLFK